MGNFGVLAAWTHQVLTLNAIGWVLYLFYRSSRSKTIQDGVVILSLEKYKADLKQRELGSNSGSP